jgi:hypothetical protein
MKKPKTAKRTPQSPPAPPAVSGPTCDEIAALAHAIWEEEGRPEGREVDHWLSAERQLRQRRAGNTPPTDAGPNSGV